MLTSKGRHIKHHEGIDTEFLHVGHFSSSSMVYKVHRRIFSNGLCLRFLQVICDALQFFDWNESKDYLWMNLTKLASPHTFHHHTYWCHKLPRVLSLWLVLRLVRCSGIHVLRWNINGSMILGNQTADYKSPHGWLVRLSMHLVSCMCDDMVIWKCHLASFI